MSVSLCRFEFKIEDAWIGLFWKHGYANTDAGCVRLWTDIWICFVPCIPLHLTIVYPVLIDE